MQELTNKTCGGLQVGDIIPVPSYKVTGFRNTHALINNGLCDFLLKDIKHIFDDGNDTFKILRPDEEDLIRMEIDNLNSQLLETNNKYKSIELQMIEAARKLDNLKGKSNGD